MSYTVMFLEYAEHDLKNIHSYIEIQFSQTLANRVYTEIRDAILLLEDNLTLGHMIPQLSKLGMTDYRYMVVGRRNRIIYQIEPQRKHIYIYLICNERQDFDAALSRRMLEM